VIARRGAPSASEGECQKKERAPRVPAIQRVLEFQRLLDSGEVKNRAEIARRYGLSRARVTQILNTLRLPREILDHLKSLVPAAQRWYTERRLRGIAALPSRHEQLAAFRWLTAVQDGPLRRFERGAGYARCERVEELEAVSECDTELLAGTVTYAGSRMGAIGRYISGACYILNFRAREVFTCPLKKSGALGQPRSSVRDAPANVFPIEG